MIPRTLNGNFAVANWMGYSLLAVNLRSRGQAPRQIRTKLTHMSFPVLLFVTKSELVSWCPKKLSKTHH